MSMGVCDEWTQDSNRVAGSKGVAPKYIVDLTPCPTEVHAAGVEGMMIMMMIKVVSKGDVA